MKNKRILFFAVLLCILLPATNLFGQSSPLELGVALTNGNVTLSATGNGSCAGLSIEGRLTNNTSVEISINWDLKGGLYLANSGSGQNMLATRVYPTGYIQKSANRVLRLLPRATVGVVFEAYCTDFDLDNPTKDENFSWRVIPQAKLNIASQVSRYSEAHINVDLVVPIQIALWRAEGKSWEEIEEKIDFDIVDWGISTEILSF